MKGTHWDILDFSRKNQTSSHYGTTTQCVHIWEYFTIQQMRLTDGRKDQQRTIRDRGMYGIIGCLFIDWLIDWFSDLGIKWIKRPTRIVWTQNHILKNNWVSTNDSCKRIQMNITFRFCSRLKLRMMIRLLWRWVHFVNGNNCNFEDIWFNNPWFSRTFWLHGAIEQNCACYHGWSWK